MAGRRPLHHAFAPLALAVLVACVLVGVFAAPGRGWLGPPGDAATAPEIVPENFELPEKQEAQEPADGTPSGIGTKEHRVARQAAPGFAVPLGNEPLERIAPRPPLSELSLAPPPTEAAPAPNEIRYRRLHRPLATAAGRIEADGHVVEVQGIDIPSLDETCTDPAGANWPCGMQARTAFRAWLRARAIMCRLPAAPMDSVMATDCTLGGEDVAAWLVDNGWARASEDGPYVERARKAQEARAGIFGPKPDSEMPEFSAPPPVSVAEPQ